MSDRQPTPIGASLLDAAERLIQEAYPGVSPETILDESDAVSRLAALAYRLQAAGDPDIDAVIRGWMWDGIVAMLEDAGYEFAIGGAAHYESYMAFIHGQPAPDHTLPEAANIVLFPTRTSASGHR